MRSGRTTGRGQRTSRSTLRRLRTTLRTIRRGRLVSGGESRHTFLVQWRSSIGSLVGTFIVMAIVVAITWLVMVVGLVGGVRMVVVRMLAMELLLNGWQQVLRCEEVFKHLRFSLGMRTGTRQRRIELRIGSRGR